MKVKGRSSKLLNSGGDKVIHEDYLFWGTGEAHSLVDERKERKERQHFKMPI